MTFFRVYILSLFLFFFIGGCISNELRMPSSISDVYSNSEMKQSLLLAAQNKILFHLPSETISEAEKTEIDTRCRKLESPFWAAKLSMYLSIFRSKPELFSKIHIIEMRKGDVASVEIQKDMDQISILKIQYVKAESRGKVTQSTNLPCQGSMAEYIGRDLVKTEFEFPSNDDVVQSLLAATEKKESLRFSFATDFLTYLAERGMIFKFTHELSFEKLPSGQFVMAQLLNQYAEELKSNGQRPTSQSHMNLWIKKINENSKQAELIQFFSVENDQQLKMGVKIDGEKEISKKLSGSQDLTYLFTTYHVDGDKLQLVSLERLNQCLQKMTIDMGAAIFRIPSSENEKTSYLYPGYSCKP